MARRRPHRVAPNGGAPAEVECCYCRLRYFAKSLSSHVCSSAPELPDAPLDYKSARRLTLDELKLSLVEAGLPVPKRILRELASKGASK